ncbi:response regulator transcription factor [Salipaludibacillus sp. LMS25]|jgi:two-component system LytT family response regulator|uniref:LytR/AlgR family response regulator transcription factor n=1 Tax=Salipaludibacillus sp. LMS25 TaxID=2924031 RepID=UPI0020D1A850|nr:response regulator transcription factor [Salipaludibacillus sp. LMS25]UTR16467.1 response regulator transcription factor [Salipaludibacillus sp. LMS25]
MKKDIKLGVVDDDINIHKGIENMCMSKNEISVRTYSSGISLIEDLSNDVDIDILLLDISMPTINGFDIAEHVRVSYPSIKIIFMSSNPDYALKGYKYYPEDFITKPINVLRLMRTINRIIERENSTTPKVQKIGVRTDGKIILVEISKIIFIEKKGKKSFIHLEGSKVVEANEGLSKLELMLSEYQFYRAHQSFLIATEKIEEIEIDNFMRSYNIKLVGTSMQVSLSRNKYKELKNLIKDII